MASDAEHHRRGVLKLMLKRPALRARLQALIVTDHDLLGLCEAFEDATATLEKLRTNKNNCDQKTIEEYENLCDDIEREVAEICQRASSTDN